MPGIISPDQAGTDYLTNFVLHRTVSETDNADLSTVEPILDLSRSKSARRNTVLLIPKQTSGTQSRIKFEFYLKLVNPPAGLVDQWILVDASQYLSYLEIADFNELIAGFYKIRAILETPGTGFEVYLAHNQYLPQ